MGGAPQPLISTYAPNIVILAQFVKPDRLRPLRIRSWSAARAQPLCGAQRVHTLRIFDDEPAPGRVPADALRTNRAEQRRGAKAGGGAGRRAAGAAGRQKGADVLRRGGGADYGGDAG